MLKRLFASRKRPYVTGINPPERVSVNLSGCQLELTLPVHFRSDGFEADLEPTDIPDIYPPEIYNYGHSEPQPFSYASCIRRGWEYFGPIWRGRNIGRTSFQVSSLRIDCLPKGMSCFNPAHLEQVVLRYLYDMGPGTPDRRKQVAPVNWRVEDKQGNLWVLFESQNLLDPNKEEGAGDANYKSFAVTAIDDRYLLFLRFSNFGYLPVKDAIENINKVRDLVCGSIHWTLSDALASRKVTILQQYPNATISSQRDPEPWVYPTKWRAGDREKGEPRLVIVEPGSPEPEFKI
ncbi:MAG: hypothetical protein ABNH16_11935 [Thalassolituus sp.]|jgi:hypothetical protein|nr:MAG: hypothetical protein COA68_04615 [Oceanobacter sp.]